MTCHFLQNDVYYQKYICLYLFINSKGMYYLLSRIGKKYLEMAASKNHAHALYDLGYMYLYGVGVDKDYMMAFDYFQRSAEFDFAPAFYIMGIMYYDGAGVKKNDKKAYEYCKKAFEKGYKTSVVELDHKNKTIIIK